MEDQMSWDDMRLVLALAREGSLLGAAKVLEVNASTVGRRLEALESRLGLAIFDRTRQGVLMTAVAEQLVPFAESAEQAAADFVRVVEGFEREVEGLVRISAPPGIASMLLSAWVGDWIEAHPRLQIQLDAEVGYVDLARREADIAIRGYRPTSGDLVAVRWIEGSSWPVASPAYAEAVGEIGTLEALAALRWVNWGPGLAHLDDGVWLERLVPAEQIVLRSDSMEAQVRACAAGLGVMLMAPLLARPVGLVPLRLAPGLAESLPPLASGALWLVCHRALRRVPRIAAIWEALLNKIKEAEEDGTLADAGRG